MRLPYDKTGIALTMLAVLCIAAGFAWLGWIAQHLPNIP
jgi:hypothetical protein